MTTWGCLSSKASATNRRLELCEIYTDPALLQVQPLPAWRSNKDEVKMFKITACCPNRNVWGREML